MFFFFSFLFIVLLLFFLILGCGYGGRSSLLLSGLFKDASSGRNVGDHSAFPRPRGAAGSGRPAESPPGGGLPSSSACTVVFRCSVLTSSPLLPPPGVWSV